MIDSLIDAQEVNGRTYFQNPFEGANYEEFMKRGKGAVPIYKQNPFFGATGRKGELRQDDPTRYQKAMEKEPLISRAVTFNANMTVSYGFSFGLKRKSWGGILPRQEELIEKVENWRDYIDLAGHFQKVMMCGQVYGDAFAEKIYDNEGTLIDGNGWGVSDLKLLHPLTMFVERKTDGEIMNYYQIPHKLLGTDFSTFTSKQMIDNGIKIAPENIVHYKFGDYTNGTYGKSIISSMLESINMKIGMKQDASMMVQRRAIPTVVWRVGFEDQIPPPNLVNKDVEEFIDK